MPAAAARAPKRARFALADSTTELSNETVLSWRDNYADIMAEMREREEERQVQRKAAIEGIRLPFGPTFDSESEDLINERTDWH